MPPLPSLPPAIDVLIVQARPFPPDAGRAAFSSLSFNEADLDRSDHLDVALKAAPGVSLFRRTTSLSANPSTQGITLRAIAPSGAGRALVTLDGVPQNDPFGGWVIWSSLPIEGLSGATIIRGAGSGAYGAGALTGVVSLESTSAGSGTRATMAGTSDAGGRVGLQSWFGNFGIAAAAETRDGYVPVRGPARGLADTPTDFTSWSVAGQTQHRSHAGLISARLGGFAEDRGSGLEGARATAKGVYADLTLSAAPYEDRSGYRLQGWVRASDLTNSSVSVPANRRSTALANVQDHTPALGLGLNGAWRAANRWGVLELGVDVRSTQGETRERFRPEAGIFSRSRVAGGRTLIGGGYVNGTWQPGPWLVTLNLREDVWRSASAKRIETDLATGKPTLTLRPSDTSGGVPTGRFGLKWQRDLRFAFRAAGYSGFRPATLNELHRPFRVGNDITEANAALKPERLYGAEFGIDQVESTFEHHLTAFAVRLSAPITNVTLANGPGTFAVAGFVPVGGVLRQRRNVGSIQAYGLEWEGRWSPVAPLSLTLATAITDARVDGGRDAPQLSGKRPAQAPGATVTAALLWQVTPRLSASTALRWEGRRFEDDLNTRRLAAGSLINGQVNWHLTKEIRLFLAADNILDADIQAARAADGTVSLDTARRWRIGLSFRG